MLTGQEATTALGPVEREEAEAHTGPKPTGRKPLPDKLPRVDIEVLPPEVQAKGTDAFDKICEDVSEVVERRPSSFVVVRTRRAEIRSKRDGPTDSVLPQEGCVVSPSPRLKGRASTLKTTTSSSSLRRTGWPRPASSTRPPGARRTRPRT